MQWWLGAQIGFRDYTFSRIVHGRKPLPPEKVRRLAALVGVPETTIKEIFKVEPTDPS